MARFGRAFLPLNQTRRVSVVNIDRRTKANVVRVAKSTGLTAGAVVALAMDGALEALEKNPAVRRVIGRHR